MKIWVMSKDPIFSVDIAWGFEQLGFQTKVGLVEQVDQFKAIQDEYQADIIITVGSPIYYKDLKVLSEIRKELQNTQVKLIHWDTDGISWAEGYELPLIESLEPHIIFTVCPDMQQLLRTKGGRVERLDYGLNPKHHYNVEVEEIYSNMITYIGNSYHRILKNPNHYRTRSMLLLIATLLKQGEYIDMWGDRGLRTFYSNWGKAIEAEGYHGICRYEETKTIYSSALINLVPQNHPYYLTKRTYEIMGCKGFVVTYDTPEVRKQFNVGEDLIAVSNEKELLEVVGYFKTRTDEYEHIKSNGFHVIQKHTYKQRAEEILRALEEDGGGERK